MTLLRLKQGQAQQSARRGRIDWKLLILFPYQYKKKKRDVHISKG
jgi:hypothetical protein